MISLLIPAMAYCFLTSLSGAAEIQYNPQLVFRLSCGAPPNAAINFDNRNWVSDNPSPQLPPTAAFTSISAVSNESAQASSSLQLPPFLSSARIFNSSTRYSFSVVPGRYWVRLYFHPFAYQDIDLSAAIFSVTANSYTLLFNNNIADAIATDTLRLGYVFKEYTVNVTGTSLLLTFIPNTALTHRNYAFVNAIEVLSLPIDLFTDDASPLGVNAPTPIGIASAALETMYRLNVGGPLLTSDNDTHGLFRTWQPNETFLLSTQQIDSVTTEPSSISYARSSGVLIAPPMVYSTALQTNFSPETYPHGINLSFLLAVQPNFRYMVRLHFCELVYATGGRRVFNIYLQKQTALSMLDLGKQFGPPSNSTILPFNIAILSGLEVWKLNNSQGSLDGKGAINPMSPASSSKHTLGAVIGGGAATIVVLAVLIIVLVNLVRRRYRRSHKAKRPIEWVPLAMHKQIASEKRPSAMKSKNVTRRASVSTLATGGSARQFMLAEILDATRNFDATLIIGHGGYGKVYLGELRDGTKVAIKRGSHESQQGVSEFEAEIRMLSRLRHRHLVSLIGYCEEQNELILVYEYMAHGTLREHLYGPGAANPLPWTKRLEICIGAARGLHYLHTGANKVIIHRDVKTTNILLDENFVPKVSDFGLSKLVSEFDQTHVSTAVKGSFGYLDPEYFRMHQLTEKSDVYSFGVVLMEVLCARLPIDSTLPDEQVNLAEWVLFCKKKDSLRDIVDPHVADSLSQTCLMRFADIAQQCVQDEGRKRPTIGVVLWGLEQLLQASTSMRTEQDSSLSHSQLPKLYDEQIGGETWSKVEGSSLGDEEEEDAKAVFSQIAVPRGR
ncbi:hypothetical protein KP509_03G001200 [Ceratopteris richardii]|uniref:Protein kinase domain-containing protein n=1 Tax=Ceratopteris richardii TaxID=49495 RepID=A0A8T2V0U1_CERRI|nr:hypothetical protein KP509_03G001200 [Ceratopteris richardii]